MKMNKKLRNQNRLRLLVQCLSFAFHNGYVRGWMKGKIYTGDNKTFCVPGLNCYSCPGALGSCPIGSLQAVLDSGQYHISMYVIGFIGLVGMLCGRFVCGWLCPFGLVQDLIYKIPFVKKIKNLPGHKYLRYLRFVILAVFVIALPMAIKNQSGVGQPWFCEYICPSGTLLAGIPLVILNPALRAQIGPRFLWKVILLIVTVVLCLLSYRPFCKYVCPLGALYGAANPVSLYRFKVDKEACVTCGACQKACGMDIKVWESPNSMDCIRCGKCIAACPKDAISTTFPLKRKPKAITETEQISKTPVKIGKRVFSAIMGLACIGTGILSFASIVWIMRGLFKMGSSQDFPTIAEYMLGPVCSTVPGILMILLGVGLILSVGKKDLYDTLRTRPKKILITTIKCVAVNYILNVLDSILLLKAIVPFIFVGGVTFMVTTMTAFLYLLMILVLAITGLVLK